MYQCFYGVKTLNTLVSMENVKTEAVLKTICIISESGQQWNTDTLTRRMAVSCINGGLLQLQETEDPVSVNVDFEPVQFPQQETTRSISILFRLDASLSQVNTSMLLPDSGHKTIHLGGYNCSVCTHPLAISCVWQIAQM